MRVRLLVPSVLCVLCFALAPPSVAAASNAELIQAQGDQSSYLLSPAMLILQDRAIDLQPADLEEALSLRADPSTGQWLVLATAAPQASDSLQRDLKLVLGDGSRFAAATLPPSRAPRTSPVMLTRGAMSGTGGAELSAVAWLEGSTPRQQELWWSPWHGSFAPPQRLLGPGVGSRVSLAGVTLTSGAQLLVWSEFDGEDTEVHYLLRQPAGEWSTPARVVASDNHVPDITPTVAPLRGGGAVVAWSTFDRSEYRVVAAVFDGAQFGEPRPIGPLGSVKPELLERSAGVPQLLYSDAWPVTWRLVELRLSGSPANPQAAGSARLGLRASASAASASQRRDRPMVVRQGSNVRFAWRAPPPAGAAKTAERSVRQQRQAAPSAGTVAPARPTPPRDLLEFEEVAMQPLPEVER